MHARVTIFQTKPGKMDEAIRMYRDSVVPGSKQQKGLKGIYLLTDRNTGKGISIALWQTEADMKASESSSLQQAAQFKDLLSAPPVREQYEVSVHT